jgi:hypothetical protein
LIRARISWMAVRYLGDVKEWARCRDLMSEMLLDHEAATDGDRSARAG